jgi:hypothetical protein
MVSGVAFLDYQWSKLFSTSLGYSRIDIDNTGGQADDAFKTGQYALINLLYYPTTNVMVGGEVQWGRRDNAFDGFEVDDWRFQMSARFNYSPEILESGGHQRQMNTAVFSARRQRWGSYWLRSPQECGSDAIYPKPVLDCHARLISRLCHARIYCNAITTFAKS